MSSLETTLSSPSSSASFSKFQQALHIFRKDARQLRIEIVGILLLNLILILSSAESWESIQERGRFRFDDNPGPFIVLLPIAWVLMIGRLIQSEALPGDRHFWLTRPYDRAALMISKALFILAFVNIPLMLAQSIIVSVDGLHLMSNLGGLFANQAMIVAVILLPAVAVASLTRNLAQFLPAAVAAVAMMAGAVSAALGDHGSRQEWTRWVIAVGGVTMITSGVAWLQYRWRRTMRHAAMGVTAAVGTAIVLVAFPSSLAFAIESKLAGSPDSTFAFRIGPPPPKPDTPKSNLYRQLVKFPLDVTGANAANLRIESSTISFRTLSGVTRRNWSKTELTPEGWVHSTAVDRQFFDAAKDSPVTVRAEYYLTQFTDAVATDVPLDGTSVYIPDVGQCGTAPNYDQRTFVCRAAFRRPGLFSSDRLRDGREPHQWFDLARFPSRISVMPVVPETYRLVGEVNELAPAEPERPARIVVRKRVAYFRHVMEIPNIRLADYAVPEPHDDNAPKYFQRGKAPVRPSSKQK